MNRNGNHKTATFSRNGHHQAFPSTIPDRLQPQSVEAEEAVLGALLIDQDAVTKIVTILDAEDFWVRRNSWIFEAIKNLYAQSTPGDLLTISDELERRGQLAEAGGSAYLTGLINRTPSALNAEYYARIVKRAATLRQLISAAGDISRLAYEDNGELDDILSNAEERIYNVCSRKCSDAPRSIRDGIDQFHDRIEYLCQNDNKIIGIPTGLADLDKLLGGLQRTDMILLAGRPGSGKTSLALNIGLYAARQFQKRVAIFSLEMSEEQLVQRLVASESGIDSQRLRLGKINEDEWPAYLQATEALAQCPIFIDDTPAISAMDLRSKARRLDAEYGLDLLIVDYLQLMSGDRKSENRQQEVSFISRSVKALARELKIPVLALSQLSRQCESRADKRPILSDLRESGCLEQDSDVVIFLYRDEMYNAGTEFPNVVELIVGKHRSGPTGVFSVYFKKHLAQFVDLEIRQQEMGYEPMDWVKG